MNTRVKKLWIKALRSEKFKQGTGALKKRDDDGIIRHCCLGVLEEIAAKEGVVKRITGSYLALAVQKWAEIDTKDPILGPRIGSCASDLNDGGNSFNFIADRIEKYL